MSAPDRTDPARPAPDNPSGRAPATSADNAPDASQTMSADSALSADASAQRMPSATEFLCVAEQRQDNVLCPA